MKGVLAEKNIKITTTAPHDKQAGGRHERIIDTLWSHVMAVHHSNPHIPIKYWPLTLQFVTLVYNTLVHSTTGEIPYAQWTGRTPDISYLRAYGSQVYAYVPKQLRKSTQPRSESFVYLGHKSKTTLYVYDPVRDKIMEKGHFVRSVEFFNDDNTTANINDAPQRMYESVVEGGEHGTNPAAEDTAFSTNPNKRMRTTRTKFRLPEEDGDPSAGEGGGNPHDRQSQSKKGKAKETATAGTTPTQNRVISTEQYMTNDEEWMEIELNHGPHNLEGCARDDGKNARLKRYCSPSNSFLDYNGRPYDKIFVNPMYSEAQRYLDHSHQIWKNDKSIEITALVPEWTETNDDWQLVKTYKKGHHLFIYPEGEDAGGLRWNVKLIRLSKRDEVKQPQEVHANTKLTDIKVLRIGTYRTENYIAGIADIQCQQGTKTVSLTGLLMHYSTEVWDQLKTLVSFQNPN
ncbi:RNA-dependent DNA polymerase [Pseudoscourfieldia marina]